MGTKRLDIMAGMVFNQWTIVEVLENKGIGKRMLRIRCSCGFIADRAFGSVVNGYSKSCGCAHYAAHSVRQTKHGHSKRKEATETYMIWNSMKQRCVNPKNKGYKRYGGRGIQVCARWLESFDNFLLDMGEHPKGMQLDRIDNNSGYSKENCHWVTSKENNRNKDSTLIIEFQGVKKPFTELLDHFKIVKRSVYSRMSKGMSRDEAIESAYNSPFRGKMNAHWAERRLKQKPTPTESKPYSE